MPLRAACLWIALSCAAVGCDDSHAPPPTAGTGGGGSGGGGGSASDEPFESAHPGDPYTSTQPDAGTSTGGSGGGASAASVLTDPSGPDLDRTIERAAIARFEAGRLYAMSRHGGLTIFDVGQGDSLRVLGHDASIARTPFQLYVRDGMAIAVYSIRERSVPDAAGDVALKSLIRVLDARDPGAIRNVQELEVDGAIFDTYLRSNILYVLAAEGLPTPNHTLLSSFDVSNPAQISAVAQVNIADQESRSRTFAVSEQRLYVAFSSGDASGFIVAVDISDQSGQIVLGARVPVHGTISDRWQMDEYQGVLRVLDQPTSFAFKKNPQLETFAVASSNEITPLTSLELTPPKSGRLVQVRFDGAHAYAVMLDNPTVVLDVSDPRQPKQSVLPGSTANIDLQVQGDRALALQMFFPSGLSSGSLNLASSDLQHPSSSSSHVTLSASWSPADWSTSREHAALDKASPDGPLFVSQFGAIHQVEAEVCPTRFSAVQWCDWNDGALALRGQAPVSGQAQTAALRDARLFAFTDQTVETFDVTDPDNLQPKATHALSQHVDRVLRLEQGKLVRIGRESLTGRTQLDVTQVASAATPAAKHFAVPATTDECPLGQRLSAALAHDQTVYLVYPERAATRSRVVSVDVSDADAPRLAGDVMLPVVAEDPAGNSRVLAQSGAAIVAVGATLVFADRAVEIDEAGAAHVIRSELTVVDFSDPADPHSVVVPLPAAPAASELVVDGPIVATSHYEASAGDPSRARFYLDRVDVSNPRAPQRLPSINIPGSLLHFDRTAERALTVDYRLVDGIGWSQADCYDGFRFPHFTPYNAGSPGGTCTGTVQSLCLVDLAARPAVILQRLPLAETEGINASASGADRVFLHVATSGAWVDRAPCHNCALSGGYRRGVQPPELLMLGGLRDASWATSRLVLPTNAATDPPPPFHAHDQRVALWTGLWGEITVVDAVDVTKPAVLASFPTHVSTSVQQLEFAGDQVVAALGVDGVATLPMPTQ